MTGFSPRKLSRRAALTALGAGAAAAVLRPSRPLHAQTVPAAKYFIGVYMPHGMARELWVPHAGFDIAYQDSSLAPFDDAATYGRSFKNDIVALEGLDLTAGILAATTGHDASRVILTGSGTNGSNASIDQFLAVEQGLGNATPLPSLTLGVGFADPQLDWCISYAKGGAALPKVIDPSETFNKAFAQWIVGSDPAALARAERERQIGKSLLDYWTADLDALGQRVPATEKDKIDQHAAALRDLEKRVNGQALNCAPPSAPDPSGFPLLQTYNGGEPYFETISNLQIDLLVQAMSCDVTRFGTLFLADLSRTGYDPVLPEDVHIDVAHRYATSGRAGTGGDPKTWQMLGRQNRYTYSKVARILQRLAEANILDQTVLVAMSDMGDPAKHSSKQVPTLLAGGWGGKLKGGRHIDLGEPGTPSNRLLVSVQQAFGVDSNEFGQSNDPTVIAGALDLG